MRVTPTLTLALAAPTVSKPNPNPSPEPAPGSVCVLGAVHSGAELLADGHVVVSNLTLTLTLTLPLPLSLIRHIVVCGELSGRAFCGQAGSRDAQIVATGRFDELQP